MLDGSRSLVVGGRARRFVVAVALCVSGAWNSSCAELSACPDGQRLVSGVCAPDPQPCEVSQAVTKELPIACAFHPNELPGAPDLVYLRWNLTVEPLNAIEPSDIFEARLSGTMLFDTTTINDGILLLGDFRRAAIPNAEARIQVRLPGATPVPEDADIVLKADIPKTCTYDQDGNRGEGAGPFPSCDDDDDCAGRAENPPNRCLPYVDFEISKDCSENGVCAELGETDVCERYGFCVKEEIEVPLLPASGVFRTDESGSVFFGFADDLDDEKYGVDRGAFLLREERRVFDDPVRHSGVDIQVVSSVLGDTFVGVAWECVMGVVSRGPDGPPTTNPRVSRAPDGMLISCPIP